MHHFVLAGKMSEKTHLDLALGNLINELLVVTNAGVSELLSARTRRALRATSTRSVQRMQRTRRCSWRWPDGLRRSERPCHLR